MGTPADARSVPESGVVCRADILLFLFPFACTFVIHFVTRQVYFCVGFTVISIYPRSSRNKDQFAKSRRHVLSLSRAALNPAEWYHHFSDSRRTILRS